VAAVVVLRGRQLGGKQGVNECGFPQTRFTCAKVSAHTTNPRWVTRLTDDHDSEVSAPFGDDFVFLWKVLGEDRRDGETNAPGLASWRYRYLQTLFLWDTS